MTDNIELTIYLAGENKEEAKANWPFDSYESAYSFYKDNPGMKIYSVSASIDFQTMEVVEEADSWDLLNFSPRVNY